MQDNNKQMIEMLRETILKGEAKLKEAEKIKKETEAARAYLEVLLANENEAASMSGPDAALMAFKASPDEALSIREVLDRMTLLGWHTGATRPEAIVGGMLHRDDRFERIGRGYYRLTSKSAVPSNEVDLEAALPQVPQESREGRVLLTA